MTTLPTRGAYHFSPVRVELKPPAAERRIAVVKYSSSVSGGALFLASDRLPLLQTARQRSSCRELLQGLRLSWGFGCEFVWGFWRVFLDLLEDEEA